MAPRAIHGGRKQHSDRGEQVMTALRRFVGENPDMADRPYGDAMAATLSRAFPCQAR